MFNVGDEVEVFVDLPDEYPITRIGSYGKVKRAEMYGCIVDFEWVNWNGVSNYKHSYYINNDHLRLKVPDGLTPIIRKIRSMYARQYRKTGQSCFC